MSTESEPTPAQWARYLQDQVIGYCSMSDYVIGRTERRDIAEDIINRTIAENGIASDVGYTVLFHWDANYGQGVQNDW